MHQFQGLLTILIFADWNWARICAFLWLFRRRNGETPVEQEPGRCLSFLSWSKISVLLPFLCSFHVISVLYIFIYSASFVFLCILKGREDDNIETIRKRFKVYMESSLPVIEYYNSKGKVRKVIRLFFIKILLFNSHPMGILLGLKNGNWYCFFDLRLTLHSPLKKFLRQSKLFLSH